MQNMIKSVLLANTLQVKSLELQSVINILNYQTYFKSSRSFVENTVSSTLLKSPIFHC